MKDQYIGENDYELLYLIYQMDEFSLQTLINKYAKICEIIIYSFLPREKNESFYDEIMAECYIQLYQAVYSFRQDFDANFSTFFQHILKHHLTNFYRKRNTYQGRCQHKQVSLDAFVHDGTVALIDLIPNTDITLEGIYYLYQESANQYLKRMYSSLKAWEISVIELRLTGYTYLDIAKRLGVEVRQVEYVLTKLRNRKDSLT